MEIVVIKIGGDLAKENPLLQELLSLDVQPVVVHGGGEEVNRWLKKIGIKTDFIGGQRITDEPTLEVVIAVLCGLVNKQIVDSLLKAGAKAIGISGIDGGLLKANRKENLGYVGEIIEVNPKILFDLLEKGYMPVIAPTGQGETGPLNINGDPAAAEIAISLKAQRLIFLTDTDGVLDRHQKTIPLLDKETALRLIQEGIISGGMVIKLEAGFKALSYGVPVSIINGRKPGALLREIKEPGGGTLLI